MHHKSEKPWRFPQGLAVFSLHHTQIFNNFISPVDLKHHREMFFETAAVEMAS